MRGGEERREGNREREEKLRGGKKRKVPRYPRP